MKAFVGHSFEDKDEILVQKILTFLKGTAGIDWVTGEKPQNKSISGKVKKKIDDNELFIGIFTCDKELKQQNTSFWKQKNTPSYFTTSNWVLQESGYAIGKKRELIFLVEQNIYKFPELQGDAELIFFERDKLDGALLKLLAMIQDIRSQTTTAGKSQDAKSSPPKTESEAEKTEVEKEAEVNTAFKEMLDAYDNKDIPLAEKIYNERIKNTLQDELKALYESVILRWKYCAGEADALRELETFANASNKEHAWGQLALSYQMTKKYDKAIEAYEKTVELVTLPLELERFLGEFLSVLVVVFILPRHCKGLRRHAV